MSQYKMIAHHTGDGWLLQQLDTTTGQVTPEDGMPWPEDWPAEVTASWLRERGIEVVPAPTTPMNTENKNHWPLPWYREAKTGCFGAIEAANGEPVAQVQALAPKFERDPKARSQWRNEMADYIIACVNACAGMPDPAAEIEAMREAMQASYVALVRHDLDYEITDDESSKIYVEVEDQKALRAALAKLQPFVKP